MSKPLDVAYQNIRQILEDARTTAYTAVNVAMVQAYWNIGRIIVEEEQRGRIKAGYGERLIKELAEQLTKNFGKGFTISNLKYFRQFYLSFSIGHALRGQSQIPKEKGHAVRDELPVVRIERIIAEA